MKLYNSLTRKKQVFKPLKSGVVSMYSCGPTVYNYAHIGNLRTYIFMDLLRRALVVNGYKIKGVLNITDVGHLLSDADEGEDKMALAAKQQKKSPWELAAHYTEAFLKDTARLNIAMPETVEKVTGHIDEMISFVEELIKRGFGYEISDGIYFDTAKFAGYGVLSGQSAQDKQAGARVAVNSEKRSPHDFALWKKAEPNHIMQWKSPWGMGYPGWHIECSALSRKFLGKVIDIHTGGVDHIPVHHENEIAQNFGRDGVKKPLGGVNYWLHGEFMLVDGGKMSKSLNNTYTLDDLEKRGFCPLDFRYFCLGAHYRKKLNFTWEALSAAKQARLRLSAALNVHRQAGDGITTTPANHNVAASSKQDSIGCSLKLQDDFFAAVSDDLNVPLALGVLHKMLKLPPSLQVYNAALECDAILGLSLAAQPERQQAPIPAEITALAEQRLLLKQQKNWADADALRNRVAQLGYTILDTKDGFTINKN